MRLAEKGPSLEQRKSWCPETCKAVRALVAVILAAAGFSGGATTSTITASAASRPLAARQISCGRLFPHEWVGRPNPNARVPKPAIVSKAEWGGTESSGTLRRHIPQRVTLHHEGSAKPLTGHEDPRHLLRNLQRYCIGQKGWPDIPYHFLVDLDGRIYQARDPLAVGDTNTQYDPMGHLLVTLIGNYELQAPTKAQLDSICDLVAWLCDFYNIDPSTIACHREFAQTACPGRYFTPYVLSGFIEEEVRARIRAAYNAR